MKNEKLIKVGMIVLLLLCFFRWSYGFYEFVRFATMAGFLYLSFLRYDRIKKIDKTIFIYIMIALLFQPFYKIALGRFLWNLVDLLVACFLAYEIMNKRK
ncbi:hypothetical protein NMK71_05030 [Weeksellaceae bacterium KMM 9713]|uniref:Uncharacterized protein n=1 Tax=Profundicola chukchiensis TaxID=2961959 RepID=A0A9X4MZL7_9FLAO|nr:DUF6804 family protein [Profundicola chukchiensis]MDG4945770.1 hypothetical protein [Profundicola chukchiensis]